jgi:hypothetical protein
MMNFPTCGVRSGHVDIAPGRPYLCRIVSTAMTLILLAFLPFEPWMARFPLNWRMTPSPPVMAPRRVTVS